MYVQHTYVCCQCKEHVLHFNKLINTPAILNLLRIFNAKLTKQINCSIKSAFHDNLLLAIDTH